MPSMHREDYAQWARDHPIAVAVIATSVATSIISAIFWIAVLT